MKKTSAKNHLVENERKIYVWKTSAKHMCGKCARTAKSYTTKAVPDVCKHVSIGASDVQAGVLEGASNVQADASKK